MSRLDPVKEALAAKALAESLRSMGEGEDDALLMDTVEGETNLFELIDAVLARSRVDGILVTGLTAVISDLAARKARFEKRIAASRALIEQALLISEMKSFERPTATLTLADRAPTLMITSEGDIPARFWKPGEPSLDKKAVLAALKERQAAVEALGAESAPDAAQSLPPEIPGACLSNAAPSLQIRTK